MSGKTMDIYAERARTISDNTLASGRLLMTEEQAKRIVPHIKNVLDLQPNDRVLDIGSGFGRLTIPLSHMVKSITAVDHPDVLARLRADAPNNQEIECLPGNFLSVDLGDRMFTKVFAWAMFHYLKDNAEIAAFLNKALAHMTHRGLLLLGDLPNDDYAEREFNTADGQRGAVAWTRDLMSTRQAHEAAEGGLPEDTELVTLNDTVIDGIVHAMKVKGHHARTIPQTGLEFSHRREDILIVRLVKAPKRYIHMVTMSDGKHAWLDVRRVQPYDCDLLYEWSQDEKVRKASIRTEPFTIEDHRVWFSRKFSDPDTAMWMLENAETHERWGQIRYERVIKGRPLWTGGPLADETHGSEVSLSIADGARGYGFAKYLLETTAELSKDFAPFIALIRPENGSSIRAFERAGYKRVGEEERMGVSLVRFEHVR
jgi:cyclopropane fatty-acyl-phospholipid synthase-like methyltransferase/ribosomal protein S18 acetylase RimI-like enzyme